MFVSSEGFSGFSVYYNGYLDLPIDYFDDSDIEIVDGGIFINISNYSLNRHSSDSMSPILGNTSTSIMTIPLEASEVNIGDVVSFKKDGLMIVHRVVDKGIDDEGVYFITKGDNNAHTDDKIRFEDIKGVLIGIFY